MGHRGDNGLGLAQGYQGFRGVLRLAVDVVIRAVQGRR